MTQPIAILRTGAITSVGMDVSSSCAALRTRLNNFTETVFFDSEGEPVVAGMVDLPPLGDSMSADYMPQSHAVHRQIELLARALIDCGRSLPVLDLEQIPLLLCVSEITRPGRPEKLDTQLLTGVQQRLRCRFSPESAVYAYGQAGAAMALNDAFSLLRKYPLVFMAGVDSLTDLATLSSLYARGRIFSKSNIDGYIPGEAACAVLLGQPSQSSAILPIATNIHTPGDEGKVPVKLPETLYCTGLSVAREMALPGGDEPNLAQGMTQAIRGALQPINDETSLISLRICSQITSDYSAKEMAMGSARAHVSATPLWCLADSLGETGAAAGPLSLAWAYSAMHKGYAPGPHALSLLASEEGERSTVLLSFGRYQP